MSLAPGANPVDIEGPAEVVAVLGLAGPAALARGLAGLAARGFGAVLLMPEIAIVGKKKLPTVLAFSLADATTHGPTPPWVHDPEFRGGPAKKRSGVRSGKKREESFEMRALGRRRPRKKTTLSNGQS
jgi:hypothetical protein